MKKIGREKGVHFNHRRHPGRSRKISVFLLDISYHGWPPLAEVAWNAGGENCRDCSPSNPNRQVWQTAGKLCITRSVYLFCHTGVADCVAILLCHYETPLRRRGNLMYSWTYEIASVVSLPRNDMRSVIFVYCVFWFYLPTSIIIILKKEKIQWLFMMNENLVCLLRRAVCWFSGNAFQAKLFTDGCDGGGLICFSHKA